MTYSNHSRPEIMLPGEMIIIFSLATRYCSIKISNETLNTMTEAMLAEGIDRLEQAVRLRLQIRLFRSGGRIA